MLFKKIFVLLDQDFQHMVVLVLRKDPNTTVCVPSVYVVENK